MKQIQKLLLENKAWAKSKVDIDPEFFTKMAVDQKPQYLWIGCADSRVQPSELTNTDPGEMFVHRNIANLVIHTDMNCLSVLQYAVHYLEVPHVIICGHYGCGGVKAALSTGSLGLIDNWVRNIKDTYFTHKFEIEQIKDETERVNKLVEFNVVAQARNLVHTSIIQNAWAKRQKPFIHGWVYDLASGHLKELITIAPNSEVDRTHKYEF